jgi:WD40 repeat protein
MSSEVNPFISLDMAEGGQAPLDVGGGGQDDAESTMFTTKVATKDNDDRLATSTAPASPGDGTRSIESPSDGSGSPPGRSGSPRAANQLRDPNRYQVLGEHGRGGLGRVSRAHDLELGRDVAIKELIARGNVNEARFLREALITARLEHPSIVPVHEAGHWPDGTPFYAMKLVAGRPLRDLIAERTTVEERIGLLHHVIAVADAIAYAHGRNIIHRDLKPGNVIVGDFGETVVIDWGIAKDLTATEEPSIGGGSPRGNLDHELTTAGSILGTPGYMAPEQRRGESVDQRADVFAIGAMLWELCSLDSSPPSDPRQYHRLLRRAGVDNDLITIIAKALDPDPERRYPDAGALTADLKAFKSGARIAARSYSLFAMLAHWTRRHRALAASALVATALVIAGSVLYVRNIAVAQSRAEHAQGLAEGALDELTLKHAQLLLTTDPSAALDLLANYEGSQGDRVAQIRAEAIGRGRALIRVKPHGDSIRWMAGLPDGSITSMSTDGTIKRTVSGKTPVTLSRGVSLRARIAYAPSRGLLAYSCDPADVCIWDVIHGVRVPIAAEFRNWQLAGISFSPDGSKLAMLSAAGIVCVFDLSEPGQPITLMHINRAKGVSVLFVDNDIIAVGLLDSLSIELIHLTGEAQILAIHDQFIWGASSRDHRVVLATLQGEGLYLDNVRLRIIDRTALCHSTPTDLKFVPKQHVIAYSCSDGTVGLWDLDDHIVVLLAHLEGHADRLEVSETGDYLVASGGNGTFVVIDLFSKIVTSYRGHSIRVTAMSTPTSQYPYFISGDAGGTIRVWPVPSRIARVLANVHMRFTSGFFNGPDNSIVATTLRDEITVFSPPDKTRSISPHLGSAVFLERASNGNMFAAYGFGESVEIWTTSPLTRKRIIETGQGAVSRVAFIDQTDDLVTAGRDGRIIYWRSTGEQLRTVTVGISITDLVLISETKSIVIETSDGAIWRVDDKGQVFLLRRTGAQVVRILRIPASASVCIAYESGDVIVVDTTSWQQVLLLHISQSIRDISFANNGNSIAVVDVNDVVHVAYQNKGIWIDSQIIWTTFIVRAQKIALSPSGVLIMLCSDGTIWLYSLTNKTWMCVPTGTADLRIIAISEDGQSAAAFDTDGRIVGIELRLARGTLSYTSDVSKELQSK